MKSGNGISNRNRSRASRAVWCIFRSIVYLVRRGWSHFDARRHGGHLQCGVHYVLAGPPPLFLVPPPPHLRTRLRFVGEDALSLVLAPVPPASAAFFVPRIGRGVPPAEGEVHEAEGDADVEHDDHAKNGVRHLGEAAGRMRQQIRRPVGQLGEQLRSVIGVDAVERLQLVYRGAEYYIVLYCYIAFTVLHEKLWRPDLVGVDRRPQTPSRAPPHLFHRRQYAALTQHHLSPRRIVCHYCRGHCCCRFSAEGDV